MANNITIEYEDTCIDDSDDHVLAEPGLLEELGRRTVERESEEVKATRCAQPNGLAQLYS